MQHFAKPDAVAVLCATTSGNIGDHIQTVGLESAIHKAFGDSCRVVRLRRDAVSSFREDVPVVVSGWYSHWHAMDFVPAVPYVVAGTILVDAGRKRVSEGLGQIRGSFGAMDMETIEWCNKSGIDSYFCRSMGLCVPRFARGSCSKVFLVDVAPCYDGMLPYIVGSDDVVKTSQQLGSVGSPARAVGLLRRYCSEARLVVTSDPFVAIPCVAMGVPVVALSAGQQADPRWDALTGVIPVHTVDACKAGAVDFDAEPVDASELSGLLVENLRLSVCEMYGDKSAQDELADVRRKISAFTAI